MASLNTHRFTAEGVRSLAWRGDELIDWVGGGRSFALDGTERRQRVSYAYKFDSATTSPDGRFAVIYENTGTKALLLDEGKIVRELNRSFYHAGVYEYPVSFLRSADGRLLLAHCPNNYCRIDFEDVDTGQLLAAAAERKPADFFHSRLSVSPGGKRLLSAGWIWHPWSEVRTFEVADALQDPRTLDRGERVGSSINVEQGTACWLSDDRIVVGASASEDVLDEEYEAPPGRHLMPFGLAVFDVAQDVCVQAIQLGEPPGAMYAIDETRVLSLYRHPKVIDLSTGKVVVRWTELNSGQQDSSIVWHLKGEAVPPPMTFDSTGKRFAIANSDTVTVIDFAC